jgi:hypothetical protein
MFSREFDGIKSSNMLMRTFFIWSFDYMKASEQRILSVANGELKDSDPRDGPKIAGR